MRTSLPIETPDGAFRATFSEHGLVSLDFPTNDRGTPNAVTPELYDVTQEALLDALAGRHPRRYPPFDLVGQTEFRRSVWDQLQKIERGTTLSYRQVAEILGKPGGARAVGNACGANPIPVLIPCHRILAQGQRLGGFSGGLEWKIRLLEREGVRFGFQPDLL